MSQSPTSPNPKSLPSKSRQPARLIANPHSLGLLLGGKLDIPTHLIPHCLLLLSPISSTIYIPYSSPIDRLDKLSNSSKNSHDYKMVRTADAFIRHLKKESRAMSLEVDPNIEHAVWEKIHPHLKNWCFADNISKHASSIQPSESLSQLKKQCIDNHSQAEMAFIYACSYIKSGVGMEEIRFQIHDYLQSKTMLKGEVNSQVICHSLKPGKRELSVLTSPALIHFQIELRENGVSSHFFKTVGLVDPLKKKAMKVAVTRYQDTLQQFMIIIKKITSLKNPDLVWNKLFPHLFKNKEWQLFFRCLTIDPGFFLVKENDKTCFQDGGIYSLCLKDHKCGIIMGATLTVSKNRVEVLEKYGWDYLQFPW